MKQEPELVDIFAMIAMSSFIKIAPKSASNEEIAYESYKQAEAMLAERKNRMEKSDERQ
jgi:hypothetical protein